VHGDYRVWVAPDLLDSGTNYQLYRSLEVVFNQGDLRPLRAIMERASHPEIGIYKDITLLNFLGNHDVTRILSQLDDPADIYPALIFLMTAPGIPCLYYGDEVGMLGRKNMDDSAMRKPMLAPEADWPDADHRLYATVAGLAGLRKTHPSLLFGGFAALDAGQAYFAFLRRHVREVAAIILNSGSEPVALRLPLADEGLPDGTSFVDLLDPRGGPWLVQNGVLDIPDVSPGWGRILIAQV
jgi:glycosidase